MGAGPGEESEDDGFRFEDIFPALGVVEVAAEPDDGEFGREFALEGVNAAAELGEGHGVTSDGEFYRDEQDERDERDWGLEWDGEDICENPLISAHLRLFE